MVLEQDLSQRYWLFSYDNYYPGGGLNDICFTLSDIKDLPVILRESEYYEDNYFIFDSVSKKYVSLYVSHIWDEEKAENEFSYVCLLGANTYGVSQKEMVENIITEIEKG